MKQSHKANKFGRLLPSNRLEKTRRESLEKKAGTVKEIMFYAENSGDRQ